MRRVTTYLRGLPGRISGTWRGLLRVAGWCVAGCIALSQAVAGPVDSAEPHGSLVSLSTALIERIDQNEWVDVLILLDDATTGERPGQLDTRPPLATLRGAPYDARMRERRQSLDQVKDRVLRRIAEPGRLETVKRFSVVPVVHARIRSRPQLERLVRDPEVRSVEEIVTTQRMLPESLPLIGQPFAQWAGHTGAGTSVCVLDTGLDYTREAFGGCTTVDGQPAGPNCRVAYVQDFAPDDGLLDDSSLHGTHVAAIVLGAAPQTQIIGLDVFDGDFATSDYIVAAIDWCIANRASFGIAAINLSLGTASTYSSPVPTTGAWGATIANAIDAGIAVVAAAGNAGQATGLSLPAAYEGVISAGAVYDANLGGVTWSACSDSTTWPDKVTCFSNGSDFLSLLAPGALISAAGLTRGGTSMAAPFVAGSAAVLRQLHDDWTVDQIRQRLQETGTPIVDPRNNFSTPRLNLDAATGVAPGLQQRLSVDLSGSGTGTVTSNPTGISCGSVCAASFYENSLVTLTAAAAGNSEFTGWGGYCSEAETNICSVNMSQDRNVSALFALVAAPLVNGGVVPNMSGAMGSEQHFYLHVPEGAANLIIRITGGNGDADLYVRLGSPPNLAEYTCRPWLNGNEETCIFAEPEPGTYYVMIRGFSDYSGVSLWTSFDTPACAHPAELVLTNETVSGSAGYHACDTITVGPGFRVTDTGNVGLHAGRAVILRPGLSVARGGVMRVTSRTLLGTEQR